MKVLAELIMADEGLGYVFFCPGCGYYHHFRTVAGTDASLPLWQFDGNLAAPTFAPSLLVNRHLDNFRCHCYVRNGQIEYLDDCFHNLRSQTIPMQEIEW